MAEVLTMPKMSDTMVEGTIVAWHKKVGDSVKSGDIMADVQTDKATMELESYYDGVILHIGIQEGGSVPVDALIAIIGKKDEDVSAIIAKYANPTAAKTETSQPIESTTIATTTSTISATTSNSDDNRLFISPLAKKIAEDNKVDINNVKGSGEGGRIIKKDVEAALSNPTSTTSVVSTPQTSVTVLSTDSYEDVPLSQMRKTIARRLSESKFTAPHFYLTMRINMDNAIETRKKLNEFSDIKVSFNDMIIKAVASALRKHPKVNSSWLEDKIRYNHNVNIGVAVAIPDGLVVPVIKDTDRKGIAQIAKEVRELANKAKDKGLQPQDYTGNTFTISNLGMYGIENFTAIINPPDACILAVGAIVQEPIVKDGQLAVGNMMSVTLSCDHRAVDGSIGSEFLQTLKAMLEEPFKILL